MNRQKRVRELFYFREDIRSQSSKIACPRTQVFRENDKFSKTVFACSYGAQVEFFLLNIVENLMTLSLYA